MKFSYPEDCFTVCMIVKTCNLTINVHCKVATLLPCPFLNYLPHRPYHIPCQYKVCKCAQLSSGHFLTPTTHNRSIQESTAQLCICRWINYKPKMISSKFNEIHCITLKVLYRRIKVCRYLIQVM